MQMLGVQTRTSRLWQHKCNWASYVIHSLKYVADSTLFLTNTQVLLDVLWQNTAYVHFKQTEGYRMTNRAILGVAVGEFSLG